MVNDVLLSSPLMICCYFCSKICSPCGSAEGAMAACTVVPKSCCFLSSTSLAISCSLLMDSGTTFSPYLIKKSHIRRKK